MRSDATSPTRRRLLALGLTFPALAPFTGCAALAPRHLTLSQADLQAMVERQFPRERRVLEVVDLSLARPLVRLIPERNRIATELELAATERLAGRTLRGALMLDHALRYDASDATVRLAQVRVHALRLDLDGMPLSSQVARLGAVMAEQLLDDLVIHRVSDERRRALQRAGLGRADFVVTARGIELRFVEPG